MSEERPRYGGEATPTQDETVGPFFWQEFRRLQAENARLRAALEEILASRNLTEEFRAIVEAALASTGSDPSD